MDQKQSRLSRRRARGVGVKCADCVHAKFDEEWGEHTKCLLHRRRIADAHSIHTCKDHTKKTTKK